MAITETIVRKNNKEGKMRLRYITNEKFIAIKTRDMF